MDLEKVCNSWIPVGGLWYLTPLNGLFGPRTVGVGAWSALLELELFSVRVGLGQASPLSTVVFITFMDRISRRWEAAARWLQDRVSSATIFTSCTIIYFDFVTVLKKICLDKMSFFIVFYFNQFCHLLESIFVCALYWLCELLEQWLSPPWDNSVPLNLK